MADTDWLFDDYSLRKFNYLGQSAAEPLNDNLSFAANALDFLSGSQSLLSIRGEGTLPAALQKRSCGPWRRRPAPSTARS